MLAERRARRAELAESGLQARAERAEQQAAELELRLSQAEAAVELARRERSAAVDALAHSDRELTAARQREFAEQALRVELEGEGGADRRRLEADTARLRTALREAERRVAEQASALSHVRGELVAARAVGPSDDPALIDALEAAQASRSAAEIALVAERNARADEVEALVRERDADRARHAAIGQQLAALRSEVERAQGRHGHDTHRAEDARRALGEVAATTQQLRDALAELQAEEAQTRADLRRRDEALLGARHALSDAERSVTEREAELSALREELVRRADDLRRARTDAAGDRAALATALQDVAAAEDRAGQLSGQLTTERAKHDELERTRQAERDRFAAELTTSELAHRQALSEATLVAEASARSGHAQARKEHGEATAARAQSEAEVRSLTEALRAAERHAEELSTRLSAAGAELGAARAGILAEVAAAEEQARAEAAQALAGARAEMAGQVGELRELVLEAERVASEREAELQAIRGSSGQAEGLQASLTDAEAERSALRGQLETALTERDLARDMSTAERARADAAEQARELVLTELAERAALEDQVRGVLVSLRAQLEEERASSALRADHDAEVERLVADLVRTSEALRAGFEAELASQSGARTTEQTRLADELAAAREQVAALRQQLGASADGLRADLEIERTARWVAEEELVTARAQLTAPGRAYERLPPSGLLPAADHPALCVTAEPASGAPGVVADLSRAAERLRELGEPPPVVAAPAPSPGFDEDPAALAESTAAGAAQGHVAPGADADAVEAAAPSHPAESADPAADGEEPASQPSDVVALPDPGSATAHAPAAAVPEAEAEAASDRPDVLAEPDAEPVPRAVDAVVEAAHPTDPAPATDGPAEEPGPDPDRPAAEVTSRSSERAAAIEAAEALGFPEDLVAALAHPLDPDRPTRRGRHPEPASDADATPTGGTVLPPPRPGAVTGKPWLGAALAKLAETDEAAAERVLLALLPLQGLRADRDVVYGLTLPSGVRRVAVTAGQGACVTRSGDEGPEGAAFHVTGPAGALGALVAGGPPPRRLAGAKVRGRRRLRRLLKAQRAPIGLAEAHAHGACLRAGDLMRLLCSAADPSELAQAPGAVDYVLETPGGEPERLLIVTELEGAADDAVTPAATVTVPRDRFVALLAGTEEANVTAGDPEAVRALHALLLSPQG